MSNNLHFFMQIFWQFVLNMEGNLDINQIYFMFSAFKAPPIFAFKQVDWYAGGIKFKLPSLLQSVTPRLQKEAANDWGDSEKLTPPCSRR